MSRLVRRKRNGRQVMVRVYEYACEGCGKIPAEYQCGRSTRPRAQVPNGIARWCYGCSRQFLRGKGT